MTRPIPTESSRLPWAESRVLQLPTQLGHGLDQDSLHAGLQRLITCEEVSAVVLFGSRAQGTARADSDLDLAVICQEQELTSQQRMERWRTYRKAIGPLGCGIDLVLQREADATNLGRSIRAVHLFGSILDERFREHSGLDLLMEGLPPMRCSTLSPVARAAGPLAVDLKHREHLSDDLVDQLLRRSRTL